MLLKNKIKNLKNILNSDNVLATLEERYCYSKDALNKALDSKIPDLVVFVENIPQIQKILKYANDHKIPIISRGAGTNMVGACSTPKGGIVLNFSKMNKILDINPNNMTMTVQPGVILNDIKESAEALNLFFPPDPSNYKVSTIGGAIAQSSGGAMAFKYGTTKDYVLSLKVITADGRILTLGANTHKDAVGYHLNQLMVGSEGTLAIIAEAVLKLIPKPSYKITVSAYFDSIHSLTQTVDEIISKNIYPSAIDFMDENSIKTVEKYCSCGLDTSKKYMLLIDLEGYEKDYKSQLNLLTEIINKYCVNNIQIAETEQESEKFWNARRVSYAATTRLAPDVISDDIIVPRQNLEKMINFCYETTTKYNLKICLVGHIGDGNLHPQIALDIDNEQEFKNYTNAKSEIYKKVIELGGTISAEHGIGVEKLSYIDKIIDKDTLEYMKLIKKAFDPNGILNPGKIFEMDK